jgi:hypothetical protein
MNARAGTLVVTMALVAASASARAHSGPPFPIVSDQVAGPYVVSIWTDPDTTDDGSPGGQFWVRLGPPAGWRDLPARTRAVVAVKPLDRHGPPVTAPAAPVRGDVTNQFAALVMDHEGRFAVHVSIEGPLGTAAVQSAVEATYDLRPSRSLFALYLAPFVLVGLLWGRLLASRRSARRQGESTRGRVS